jgi:hypothetical protein
MKQSDFVVLEKTSYRAKPREAWTPASVHVLFVGPEDLGDAIHDALLDGIRSRVFATRNFRELWLLPTEERFHVAILHQTLSEFDLETASRIVRRRWPQARILLMRAAADFLEDALYDDRVAPPVGARTLLKTVRRMLNHPWA